MRWQPDMQLQCFDIHSTKERQFGFTALLPDGQRLCCLGDEPYNPLCEQYTEAQQEFAGQVWVPDDLERIML